MYKLGRRFTTDEGSFALFEWHADRLLCHVHADSCQKDVAQTQSVRDCLIYHEGSKNHASGAFIDVALDPCKTKRPFAVERNRRSTA